ncbi:hypothetical protein QQF64_023262 [Cirrhinus molitorella]|uniref:Uncharacterized protein n=1 Tax=Cirrhinus molitorella TaxID=172907 RepID=A0ABR3L7A7_9TELE
MGLSLERRRHIKKAIISPSPTMIDSRTSPRCKPEPLKPVRPAQSHLPCLSQLLPHSQIPTSFLPLLGKLPVLPPPSPSLLKTNSPAEPCRLYPAAKTPDSDTWCGNVFMFHCKFMKSRSAPRPPGKGSGK